MRALPMRIPFWLVVRSLILTVMVVVVTLTLGMRPGLAAEDRAEGRRRFERGSELYSKGRFLEAAAEFEAGYKAAPRPLFLLNIAHSYRRGGELKKARATYVRLLEVDPQIAQRAEIEGYIQSIDDALGAAELPVTPKPASKPAANTAATSPKPAPPPPAEPGDVYRRPASPNLAARNDEPAPTNVFTDASEPAAAKNDESIFSKPWFWVITATVLVGAGIATATLVRSEPSCPGTVCFKEPSGR